MAFELACATPVALLAGRVQLVEIKVLALLVANQNVAAGGRKFDESDHSKVGRLYLNHFL